MSLQFLQEQVFNIFSTQLKWDWYFILFLQFFMLASILIDSLPGPAKLIYLFSTTIIKKLRIHMNILSPPPEEREIEENYNLVENGETYRGE